MKRYKVLWFDDKFKTSEITFNDAYKNDIDLVGFTNAKEGLIELDGNLKSYDAVIVDGLFYNDSKDSGDAVNENALQQVISKLIKWEDRKKIPWYILSGEKSITKEHNAIVYFHKNGKVYDKKSDADYVELWGDIKRDADEQIETQIRHRFQNVFDVCTKKYFLKDVEKYLFEILLCLENQESEIEVDLHFNPLRKIIEFVFRASNKFGLLHDKCIPNGIVNLSWSSLFMAGKEVEIKPTGIRIISSKTHFPLILANNVKSILDITSAASHTEGEEKENGKVNFTEYKKLIDSNYLFHSLTYQVMDLLLWFKKYADENPDVEKNKSQWEPINATFQEGEWIRGEVLSIHANGFAFFKPETVGANSYIHKNLVDSFELKKFEKIQVVIKKLSDEKSEVIEIKK